MKCPSLNDLPLPPPGKTGWPWTEESPQLPDKMPDGSAWPKISIVTPSLNQGQFIEETIRSVLLQGYPNLEYIIIDGASTDESVKIIKKYEKWITHWESQPDRGQSHALNKGFKLSTGDIIGWLNADDLYLPSSFKEVSIFFFENQEVHMAYGVCSLIDENSKYINEPYVPIDFDLNRLIYRDDYIPQPSTFFRRSIFDKVRGVNESLQYSMDYDFWIRIGLNFKVRKMNGVLSCFRIQPQQKTFSTHPDQYRENLWIRARYGGISDKYLYVRHLLAEIILPIKSIRKKNRQPGSR